MVSKLWRGAVAVPFLLLATWSFQAMDLAKLADAAQPSADAKAIEWDGNKVKIIDFHGLAILDDLWRGGTATFSTSSFGYDKIAAWQVFTFLIDLGPIYAVWILDSTRRVNSWSPAYFPTLFSFVAQLFGIGTVAPFFYFLCIVFSPTSGDLAKAPTRSRTVWHKRNLLLIPLVLLLHTCEIFGMFLSKTFDDRHYWTWAWQLSPVWIGIFNLIFGRVTNLWRTTTSSTVFKPIILVLGSISSLAWIYTLFYCPYPLYDVFIPESTPQEGLILLSRKALQADYLAAFASCFLWLFYSFVDLYAAGHVSRSIFFKCVGLFPLAIMVLGPGATFLLGWYAREEIIGSSGRS